MLVARCVHGFMKSDLRQLSCHLHSPCIPLLWPFLTHLRRIAHKTNIEPQPPLLYSPWGALQGGLLLQLQHCRSCLKNSSYMVQTRQLRRPKYLGWFNDGCDCSWLVSQLCLFLSVFNTSFLDLRLTEAATAFFFQVPVIGIDSLAYGKFVIVPWNIVRYNIFGGSERGPDLYGTSPWYFYVNNLVLNFNCILPLALVSLPALGVTYIFDRKRLGVVSSASNQSSPFTVLSLRLAPLYLWFGILSLQRHKEERFMFPAYPLLCFNAAVALYLMRGWLEVAFVKVTNSPYKVSYVKVFICSGIDNTPTTGVSIPSLHELHILGRRHLCAYLCFSYFCTLALLPRPADSCIRFSIQ